MDDMRRSGGSTGFAWVLLATLILIIYSNTFQASWQLDDYPNIVHNSNLHLESLHPSALVRTFFDARGKDPNQEGRLYRPVANLTFALNWYVGRENVTGYHIGNILIHILNAFLLFGTISRLLLIRGPSSDTFFVALLATVLWAVHPIQTQAVTYIVQRMASLATFFYLVGLYSYVRARSTDTRLQQRRWLGLCLLGFLGALGCKENAATLPWALILIELVFYRAPEGRPWENRRFLRAAVIGSLAVVLLGILLLVLFKGDPIAYLQRRYAERPFTLSERLLTEPRIVVLYLSQLFYPDPQRLTLMHDITVSTGLLKPWTTLPAIFAVGGLIVLGLSQINKRPFVAFGLLFYFLNHVVESTIFPLELTFEHRNYLPSLFLFVPVAAGCHMGLTWLRGRRSFLFVLATACLALLIGAVGLGTYVRNTVWRTELTLWQDVLVKAPGLARPYQKLAEYHERRGDVERAIGLYKHAMQRKDPRPVQSKLLSLNNLGHLYYRRQNYAEAIGLFEAALALDPAYHRARYNLCLALIGSERFAAAAEQAAILVKAQPETASIMNLKGFLLIQAGRPAEALRYLESAFRLSPDDNNAISNLGLAYQLLGRHADASRILLEGVRLYPHDPMLVLRAIENALAGSDDATAHRYLVALFRSKSAAQIEALLAHKAMVDRRLPIDRSLLAGAVASQLQTQARKIRALSGAAEE